MIAGGVGWDRLCVFVVDAGAGAGGESAEAAWAVVSTRAGAGWERGATQRRRGG